MTITEDILFILKRLEHITIADNRPLEPCSNTNNKLVVFARGLTVRLDKLEHLDSGCHGRHLIILELAHIIGIVVDLIVIKASRVIHAV